MALRAHNLAAIHDRIDEEHFQVHLNCCALDALQRKVAALEAAVRELRYALAGSDELRPNQENREPSCSSQGRSRKSKTSSPRCQGNGPRSSSSTT